MWPCRHRYWYREAAEGEKLRGYKQRLVYKHRRALETAKAEGGKKWDLSPRQKQNRFLMGPRWQHAARLSRISVRKKKEEEEANIWSANPSQATSVWFVINGWGVEAHWVRDQYSSSRQICSYSRWLIVTTGWRRPPPSSSSSDEQCIIPFRNTVIKLLLCMTKQKAAMFFF